MFDELDRLEALGRSPCGTPADDALVAAVAAERARRGPLMCMIIAPDEGETEFPEERKDEEQDDRNGRDGDGADTRD